MEIAHKCPCIKTCCENPKTYSEQEEDGYCGITVCANCFDECNCNSLLVLGKQYPKA